MENRRSRWGLLGALLTVLLLVGCASPEPGRAQELLGAADVVALPSEPPELRIAYGPGELQFGHLRLPEGEGPHSVVIFVHGGCWLSQYDIGPVGPLEQAIADAGYAVWSLEYRRVGDQGGGWPGTLLDIAAGVDHLRELARPYRLDLTRVIAAGHSAGGHLALWIAARPKVPRDSEIYSSNPVRVHSIWSICDTSATCSSAGGELTSSSSAGTCSGCWTHRRRRRRSPGSFSIRE